MVTEQAKVSLEGAFSSEVARLFSNYVSALVIAGDVTADIEQAGERFKNGYELLKVAYFKAQVMLQP